MSETTTSTTPVPGLSTGTVTEAEIHEVQYIITTLLGQMNLDRFPGAHPAGQLSLDCTDVLRLLEITNKLIAERSRPRFTAAPFGLNNITHGARLRYEDDNEHGEIVTARSGRWDHIDEMTGAIYTASNSEIAPPYWQRSPRARLFVAIDDLTRTES